MKKIGLIVGVLASTAPFNRLGSSQIRARDIGY